MSSTHPLHLVPLVPPATDRNLGGFGRDFLEGSKGRHGFGTGRKLAAVDLRLIILALLAEKSCHGYEIIKALDARSGGFYVPSPGMVYPALSSLERDGHAAVEPAGTRKLHHITLAGRERLAANRDAADALLSQFERVGERMGHVRQALEAAPSGARPGDGATLLRQARQRLEAALAGQVERPAGATLRIAAILDRATADVLEEAGRKAADPG